MPLNSPVPAKRFLNDSTKECPVSNSQLQQDKKLREELTEKQIDKMVMDSFPASDPPSTY
jgi:hypothetical protein